MNNSQRNIHQELEAIKIALQQFREGATIEEIMERSGLDIEVRTLQRRLSTLEKLGSITVLGNTRSRRYYQVPVASAPENSTIVMEDNVPLTDEGKKIRVLVSLPIQRRQLVGYNRDFLTSYRPNIDSYLSNADKDRLAKIGKTANENQPAGTYAKNILQRLLIDLAWNSSRLEGNTYSLLDTQRLIAHGETADNKSATDAQMILNHKEAIEFIVQATDEVGFNRYTLLNLHALLSNNLLPDPISSGRLRTFAIGITKSAYTPLAIPQQIEEMFHLMLEKAGRISDPFEQAFFIMVQLPYLQPFDDVNKRVSRLAANIPLNRFNLAPLSFVDVPNDIYTQGMLGIYELNRAGLLKDVFMWAYERSAARYAVVRQSLGEPDSFRLKYREEIQAVIVEIISNSLSPKDGNVRITAHAKKLPKQDKPRFIKTVETELLSLHEGNFARYRVRPAEYKAWRVVWPE